MQPGQPADSACGDLHVGYLESHAYYKRKVYKIEVIRLFFITRKLKAAEMFEFFIIIGICSIIHMGVTQGKYSVYQPP